jgi:hypothetical protein
MDVHRLLLSCAEENIQDYIDGLERNFFLLVTKPDSLIN